ncbi:hypothetical protein [Lactococcus lactis]|uniref:hypothetical protein n=1 Tax=Lactococcus lactis TaxID=1358 RepID=UPI0015D540E5|nr:hypothetical protein [Lactococcus lactis]NYZ58337.1 hypothetical protein [Lactococcus lactis]
MTSNERSFPWDDHNGDREYGSDEFAEFFSTLFKPGIVATANFGSGLQIKESASLGMRVVFGAGEAFSSFGRNYVHDKDEEVTVPIASTLQDRTDSVAIQFNKSQREAFFVYKEADTTVTRTDSIFELQIAKILVPKNSTQITNANITDMRANESVCGYFSPHGKLNAGDITDQFIAWFDDFKGKLGTDPATNLQLQINDLDSRTVHNTGDEDIAGKKNFTDDSKMKNLELTGALKRANDVNWTIVPGSSNRAEYMRRGDTVTIRWDFTSAGNYDISLGSLPVAHAPQKRIFKSISEASATNSMHTLQINAFTGGSPGAITLFKATTGAVFSGQESFVVV